MSYIYIYIFSVCVCVCVCVCRSAYFYDFGVESTFSGQFVRLYLIVFGSFVSVGISVKRTLCKCIQTSQH